MPLEHDFKRTPFWRGSFVVHKRRRRTSLFVEIPCDPNNIPNSLVVEFDASRTKAETRLEDLENALGNTSDFAEALHIIEKFKGIWCPRKLVEVSDRDWKPLRLSEMLEEFLSHSKSRRMSEKNKKNYQGYVSTFLGIISKSYPKLNFCGEVLKKQGDHYLRAMEESGLSSSTIEKHVSAIRTVFNRLQESIGNSKNPIPMYSKVESETEHHLDFTREQLDAIREYAEEDDWIGPVVIIGIETGMRLGDAATLEWASVDLQIGMIDHRCRKTGGSSQENAICPVTKRLSTFLDSRPKQGRHVLPNQATRYLSSESDTSLSDAFRRLLRNVSKRLEGTPHSFRINGRRKKGKRAVTYYGFGSFRSTFITAALREGIPTEAIRLAVGHVNDKMIRKHYDRRSRSELLRVYRQWWERGAPASNRQLASIVKELDEILGDVLGVVDNLTLDTLEGLRPVLRNMMERGRQKLTSGVDMQEKNSSATQNWNGTSA